jgi:hypothetical protein
MIIIFSPLFVVQLMTAYCKRVGAQEENVRFIFDGVRVGLDKTPKDVILFPGCGSAISFASVLLFSLLSVVLFFFFFFLSVNRDDKLLMTDGDGERGRNRRYGSTVSRASIALCRDSPREGLLRSLFFLFFFLLSPFIEDVQRPMKSFDSSSMKI